MNYRGVIIEESLEDKSILKEVKILETEIEPVTKKHQTPWLKQWTIHTVEIRDAQAEEIAEKISQSLNSKDGWYADFKNNAIHFIIFHDKVFRVNRRNKKEYNRVKQYGLSLGVPDYQLNWEEISKK